MHLASIQTNNAFCRSNTNRTQFVKFLFWLLLFMLAFQCLPFNTLKTISRLSCNWYFMMIIIIENIKNCVWKKSNNNVIVRKKKWQCTSQTQDEQSESTNLNIILFYPRINLTFQLHSLKRFLSSLTFYFYILLFYTISY